jgi:membrane-associated phospholipid phosphatase
LSRQPLSAGALRRWLLRLGCLAAGVLPVTPGAAQEPILPAPSLEVLLEAPASAEREVRLLPPGLLRYRIPEQARPFAMPYAAVGTALLVADERVLRAFKLDSLYIREDGTAAHQAHLVYRSFSRLGDPPVVAAVLLGLYAVGGTRERNAARVGGVAYANTLVLTVAGKYLTGKERPYVSGGRLRYHGPNRHYASFPSGHSSGTASVAHVLAHYYPDARVLWYGLSGATGIARIGLARHWPSDVWWGWGVGMVGADGALLERERIERWRPW